MEDADGLAVEEQQDYVDLISAQWARARPDLNMAGLAVIGRVSRLSRYLERAIESSFEPLGLNSAGFYVLAALRRSGPPYRLTPTQLYSSTLTSSGAMTNRIDRLENAGYVVRSPDEFDGRSSLVALTPGGMRVVDAAIEAHTANEISLLSGLDATDRADLARLLRKLLIACNDLPRTQSPAGSHPVPVTRNRG